MKQLDKAEPGTRCTRCNKALYGRTIRYLELDGRVGVYRDPGDVPAEHSQGAFPFGLRCATREVGASEKVARELCKRRGSDPDAMVLEGSITRPRRRALWRYYESDAAAVIAALRK
jgi:hypothetical protein